MKKRLLVSMVPAVACLALAAPALAATQEGASENWAGYVVNSNDGTGFSAVSGQWKTPRVDCTANSQSSYSAYWVGLGGGGEQSSALEQIGTQADCASGQAAYYAWYELVPSAPVKIALSINPGDSIWGRTAVDGDQVNLYITDQTTHQTWSKTLTMTSATPDTSTAEWVAEAPSECAGGATSDCTPLPLANFGKATFSDSYTTSNGHTGSISDSNWTAEAIELQPSSSSLFGGGPGGYLQGGYGGDSADSSSGTTGGSAAPTALSNGGTKFTVDYGAALQTQSAGSGQSQPSSYGYGSGDGYGYSQSYDGGYGDDGGYSYDDGGYGSYGGSYGGGYGGGYGGSYGGGGYEYGGGYGGGGWGY
jgi:Peptidase A4 family